MTFICAVLGYSRQYYYKHRKDQKVKQLKEQQAKQLLENERKLLPRLGGRKLYHQIKDALATLDIKMGRDKVFDILRNNQMLIVPKRRYVQTTMSKHWLRKYPNLVKGMIIDKAEQVWVSDITYLKTDEGNCYLNLVTDAYSRKIMGYAIDDTMEAAKMKLALEMAIKNRTTDHALIHHSDRGLQYCSAEYTSIAEKNHIQISMTEYSDPYENALAERMNRTLKEEFGLGETHKSKLHAKLLVQEAVYLYNNRRPHLSLRMKTPNQVH